MTTPPNNVVPISADNNGRDRQGRFASGNAGRPFGATAKHSRTLMQLVQSMGNRAVQNLSDALDEKAQWATTLVLRYCLPANRVVEMYGAEPEDIKQALISGDLSPDESKAIASAIEKLKSVSDIDDLRSRLSELEAMLADNRTR
jgi:hypothetical protein